MRSLIRSSFKAATAAVLVGAAWTFSVFAVQPAEAAGSLVIRDFVLTHGIYEREPVGTTDSFNLDDGRAYAFVRVANDGEPTQLSFVWRYGNETHATINMNIGTSSGWRTWSSINIKPGNWLIEVKSADGMVLAQRSFMVEAPAASSSTTSSNQTMKQDSMPAPASSSSDSSYGGWTGKTDFDG